MFGRINDVSVSDVRTFILVFGCVCAAGTDLIFGKIYNLFVLILILSGILLGLTEGGFLGGLQSALGMGMALLLYGWMFGLGFMGGGDLKFLMALGALGGAKFVAEVAVLSILLGGLLALGLLWVAGRLFPFVHRVYLSALSLFVKELEFVLPSLDRKSSMPFGVPMAFAGVASYFWHPLSRFLLSSGVLSP